MDAEKSHVQPIYRQPSHAKWTIYSWEGLLYLKGVLQNGMAQSHLPW